MFDTILVPVDENLLSLRAVTTAVGLAADLSSRVLLLHVVLPLPAYTTATTAAADLPLELLRGTAETHGQLVLDGFRARVPEGVAGEAVLRHARRNVWEEILEVATELGADLIVMGTHGRDGVTRALVGSVAERVVRHAEVPVLLVR